MAYANPYLLDALLSKLDLEATRLDICSTEPTTYTQAITTYSLGNKTGISISAPVDHTPTGREVTVSAITGGTVTAPGTAGYYAITDTANSRLLAARPISIPKPVLAGSTFSAPEFTIYMLQPT